MTAAALAVHVTTSFAGEFDAMACYQATKLPTVSLPNGSHSLPVDLLPQLERFEKIYLWMDDDLPGQVRTAPLLRILFFFF
jgi:hypothetical protein